jgi:predicted DNA-binding transcriptional regulator YafY
MGILTALQSHKYITAEKIADKFEISIRTVYRDIKSLGEIGIPVSFENKRGYFIVQGYFLPPVSFSTAEANALVLVASLAERFADRATARHSLNALEKIRAVLRLPDRNRSEQLAGKIKVLNPTVNSYKYLSEIQNAISDTTILEIAYTDQKNQQTKREIEPIGLIYYTDQWHLIAWCWKRKDYRDFLIVQINSLKNTLKPFLKTDHITLEDHIRSWN